MRPMKKLLLLPNPYKALDHEGLLAGACPMGEQLRETTTLPIRNRVGAKLEAKDYQKRPIGGGQQSRARLRFVFVGEPVEVPVPDQSLETYYAHRIARGEVVLADGKHMDVLAKSRVEAIAEWRANYGDGPPGLAQWAEQFPLDAEVAKHAASAEPKTTKTSKEK